MPNLELSSGVESFKWQITGLSAPFKSSNYESAGLTTNKFTVGGVKSITGIVKQATIYATDDCEDIFTPEQEVDYEPGTHTFYAWVLVPAGTYWPAGSAEVVVEKIYKIYFDEPYGNEYVKVLKNQYPPDIDPPEKSGYRFLGYYTDEQDSVSSYTKQYYNSSGEAIKKYDGSYDSITIYSHWEKLYKIYFEEEYGDDYIEVAKGEYIPEVNVPQKDGYQFLGYWTQKNGLGAQYYDSDGIPIDEMVYDGSSDHVTLYANWRKANTITFNKNGGSGGDSSVTVVQGERIPSIKIPSRKNYSFLGYFTLPQDKIDDTIVQYYDSSGNSEIVWNYDKDITLYAHWLDGNLFAWTKEKVQGGEWNLTATEWNGLTAFINARRTALGKDQYTFTTAKKGETFTAQMYNEAVEAIGDGSTVIPWQAITAKLMNDIVTFANAMV